MLIEGRQLVLLLLSPIPQTEQTRASRVHIAAACFSTNIDKGGYISRKTHPHPSTQHSFTQHLCSATAEHHGHPTPAVSQFPSTALAVKGPQCWGQRGGAGRLEHKRSSAGFPSPARRLSPLRPLGAHRAQSEPLPTNKRYRPEVTREVGG